MAETIKINGAQVALTASGVSVSNASVVRVSLIASTNALITRQFANGVAIGSVTLTTTDSVVNLVKSPTDLLIANASSLAVATPISFT